MERVNVVGAGGHAVVVVATCHDAGLEVGGVYDDDRSKWGQAVLGVPVRGGIAQAERAGAPVIVGIGDNRARQRVASTLQTQFATVIHPTAYVHESVAVGPGTVIFAGAVIQPRTRIGAHVIINTRACIDHDGIIGDFALIAPGVALSGAVSIGEGTLVGAGASAIPGACVGAWARIGAGAAVVKNIRDNVTAVGVPARALDSRCAVP